MYDLDLAVDCLQVRRNPSDHASPTDRHQHTVGHWFLLQNFKSKLFTIALRMVEVNTIQCLAHPIVPFPAMTSKSLYGETQTKFSCCMHIQNFVLKTTSFLPIFTLNLTNDIFRAKFSASTQSAPCLINLAPRDVSAASLVGLMLLGTHTAPCIPSLLIAYTLKIH